MGVLSIPYEIKIDFYNSKYVAVRVKQSDADARNIIVACYNNGKFFKLNKNYHIVYMRFRRADDKGLLSKCEITTDGKITVRPTKQMLDVAGRCCVDLIVFDKTFAATDDRYGGMFVTQVIDDGDGNVELVLHPTPVVLDNEVGDVHIASLQANGETILIPDSTVPFITDDGNGNLEMACIDEAGEISIPGVNIATTMTFYVNVVPSVFSEGIEII